MKSTARQNSLRRRAPGAARDVQLKRIAGRPPEIDLRNLPAVLAGDRWALGEHRLLCGDCTSAEDVGAVMDGDLADLVVTDPPFGVRYTGRKLLRAPIRNDDLKGEEFRAFLAAAFRAAPLKPGGCFYICAPSGPAIRSFYEAAADAGLEVKQALIWAKNHFVLGRSDYHAKHESLLYGWNPGAPHYFGGGRKQHTLWEFPKPVRSPLHPTTKPVPLLHRAVLNSSRENEVVFDGFCGSGSTLIACELAGRLCRAIEIEPRYVAVAIARWESETGQKARLLSRGGSSAGCDLHMTATGNIGASNQPCGKERS